MPSSVFMVSFVFWTSMMPSSLILLKWWSSVMSIEPDCRHVAAWRISDGSSVVMY